MKNDKLFYGHEAKDVFLRMIDAATLKMIRNVPDVENTECKLQVWLNGIFCMADTMKDMLIEQEGDGDGPDDV